MPVTFVDCRAEHLAAVQAFFARVYRPDYVLRVDEALFRWQFLDSSSPDADAFTMLLALIDGEVAGCLGYIPVDVSVAGGGALRGAWLVNWIVDPEQRQLGLGPLLVREVTGRFAVALNVGPNATARDLLGRMGWSDLGELRRYVCVLDAGLAGRLTEDGALDWPAAGSRPLAPSAGAAASRVSEFSDDAALVWGRLWGGRATGTRRSAEYLNWRYAQHPVFDYRLFEVRDASGVAGLAVYRVEPVREVAASVGRIVELVADEGYEDRLLGALVDDARSSGVALLDFFCSSGRFAAAMARSGFLAGDRAPANEIPILFQPIDRRRSGIHFMARARDGRAITDADDWYVTKGDGDQDRPN